MIIQTGHFHGPSRTYGHLQPPTHSTLINLYLVSILIVHINSDNSNRSFQRSQSNIRTSTTTHTQHTYQFVSCIHTPLYILTVIIQTGHFHGPSRIYGHLQPPTHSTHINLCLVSILHCTHIDSDNSNRSFPRSQSNIRTSTTTHTQHTYQFVSCIHTPLYTH